MTTETDARDQHGAVLRSCEAKTMNPLQVGPASGCEPIRREYRWMH